MKKIRPLLLSFVLINSVSFSQTLFVPGGTASGIGTSTITGNVGIGNSSPTFKLDVTGNLRTTSFINAGEYITVQNGGSYRVGMNGQSDGYVTGRNVALQDRFLITANGNSYLNGGNVGIGTIAPVANLQIGEGTGNGLLNLGGYAFTGCLRSSGDYFAGMNAYASYVSPVENSVIRSFYTNAYGFSALHMSHTGEINFYSKNGNVTANEQVNLPANSVLKIQANGNVGIGTTTPSSFKLAVNGKIWSQEVNVAMTNPGPDYVFEKDYNLLPLSELETYITQNKHLPEVPSAKEMEADGLNLKEMNLILLKKVEELTLHLIEMKKENEFQQKEINALKKR